MKTVNAIVGGIPMPSLNIDNLPEDEFFAVYEDNFPALQSIHQSLTRIAEITGETINPNWWRPIVTVPKEDLWARFENLWNLEETMTRDASVRVSIPSICNTILT